MPRAPSHPLRPIHQPFKLILRRDPTFERLLVAPLQNLRQNLPHSDWEKILCRADGTAVLFQLGGFANTPSKVSESWDMSNGFANTPAKP